MYEISLRFGKREFEYDVYTLVKAFYPEADIQSIYIGESEHPAESDLKLDVLMYDWGFHLVCETQDKKIEKSSRAKGGRTEQKSTLKRLIYDSLSTLTKKELPWGTLTGIRPSKIPMKLLEEGRNEAEIVRYMREVYYTSQKKAELAIAVAKKERELIEPLFLEDGYSLYIGIPFCPSVCLYCSFGSHPFDKWGHLADTYLSALYRELEYIARAMRDKRLCTIYIGGGTPTTLSAGRLEELLGHIHKFFDLSSVKEFTVEAGRPDTIDAERLEVLREYEVDRISVNPQTMNQRTLDIIGRSHTIEQAVEAFKTARGAGFKNINMDLIVGLPGEGEEELHNTVFEIEKLKPDALTVHSLALKRATRFALFKEQYAPYSFRNSQAIMDIIDSGAKRMDMEPYYMYRQKNIAGNMENIGYAKKGCFGLYNIIIMEEKQTIVAAGSGAISKFLLDGGRIERVANVKDLNNYIGRIDEMLERKEKYLKCS